MRDRVPQWYAHWSSFWHYKCKAQYKRVEFIKHVPIPEGVRGEEKEDSMKPLSLLDGQRIKICDHKWDGRSIHDFNDPSAAIHLDKEPNYGLEFHGKIRIPLKWDVSIDVP